MVAYELRVSVVVIREVDGVSALSWPDLNVQEPGLDKHEIMETLPTSQIHLFKEWVQGTVVKRFISEMKVAHKKGRKGLENELKALLTPGLSHALSKPGKASPLHWNHKAVANWLASLDIDEEIINNFVKAAIDGPTLLELEQTDLEELGVASKIVKKKILANTKLLKKEHRLSNSLVEFKGKHGVTRGSTNSIVNAYSTIFNHFFCDSLFEAADETAKLPEHQGKGKGKSASQKRATLKEPAALKERGPPRNGEWDSVQFPEPTRIPNNEPVLQPLAKLANVSQDTRAAITSSSGVHAIDEDVQEQENAGAAASAAGTGDQEQGNAGAAAGKEVKHQGNAGAAAGTAGEDQGNAGAAANTAGTGNKDQRIAGAAAASTAGKGLLKIHLDLRLTFDGEPSEIAWVSVSVPPTDSFGFKFDGNASPDNVEEGMCGMLIVHISSRESDSNADDHPEFFALLDSQFYKNLNRNMKVSTLLIY
eukprot:g70752.t1